MAQLRRLVRVRVVELLEAYRVRLVFEEYKKYLDKNA
jgi:hypothetical protein